MEYKSGKGGMMNKVKGIGSYSKNPCKAPRQVEAKAGPGGNADQTKANSLLQKAQKQQDSLRGMSGM